MSAESTHSELRVWFAGTQDFSDGVSAHFLETQNPRLGFAVSRGKSCFPGNPLCLDRFPKSRAAHFGLRISVTAAVPVLADNTNVLMCTVFVAACGLSAHESTG